MTKTITTSLVLIGLLSLTVEAAAEEEGLVRGDIVVDVQAGDTRRWSTPRARRGHGGDGVDGPGAICGGGAGLVMVRTCDEGATGFPDNVLPQSAFCP